MPSVTLHAPRLEVRLYKTISRTIGSDGLPSSMRYSGKDEYIDLAPMLGDGSSVRTRKSVKEPAGGFSITIADRPNKQGDSLESIAGLVEPQDIVEIRMSHYATPIPPVIMRGFVSNIRRSQVMGPSGRPQRSVVITGHDYGKIWQMIQILFKPLMLSGQGLLTNFKLFELFGVGFQNAMSAPDFIKQCIEKIVNKHLGDMMPPNSPNPTSITPDMLVQHGTVSINLDQQDGATLYDVMRLHGDVGIWNELYTEDRQDGVYGVYRPTPALSIGADKNGSRKIQPDAPDPVYVEIPDDDIIAYGAGRSDANVANFYWVEGAKFDMTSNSFRLNTAFAEGTVVLNDYPNTAVKYYGPRAMYASTQQGADATTNHKSGLPEKETNQRNIETYNWIEYRRKAMVEMNKDNVILESGTLRTKGGPMREDSSGEPMKAGDYARVRQGQLSADYYVPTIEHEFLPYQGYFSTLELERGEGFVARTRLEGGRQSPWLVEQARRGV